MRPDKLKDRKPFQDANRTCLNLMLTCKKFHDLTQPFLYRITALTSSDSVQNLLWTLESKPALGKKIYALYHLPTQAIMSSVDVPKLSEALARIFTLTPNLYAVRVPPKLSLSSSVVAELTASGSTLQSLSMGCTSTAALLTALDEMPHLSSMTAWLPNAPSAHAQTSNADLLKPNRRHQVLDSLTLLLGRKGEHIMRPFARTHLPSLTQLAITAYGTPPAESLTAFFKLNGSTVTHLCLSGRICLPSDLLSLCPRLVFVQMDGIQMSALQISAPHTSLELISMNDKMPAYSFLMSLSRDHLPKLRKIVVTASNNFLQKGATDPLSSVANKLTAFELCMAHTAELLHIRSLDLVWQSTNR